MLTQVRQKQRRANATKAGESGEAGEGSDQIVSNAMEYSRKMTEKVPQIKKIVNEKQVKTA